MDFAVGSFTVTSHRERVIDFTVPIWRGSYSMVMRTVGAKTNFTAFLTPFHLYVWLAIITAVFGISFIAWFASNFSQYYAMKSEVASHKIYGVQTALDCLWYIFGMLLSQSKYIISQIIHK